MADPTPTSNAVHGNALLGCQVYLAYKFFLEVNGETSAEDSGGDAIVAAEVVRYQSTTTDLGAYYTLKAPDGALAAMHVHDMRRTIISGAVIGIILCHFQISRTCAHA